MLPFRDRESNIGAHMGRNILAKIMRQTWVVWSTSIIACVAGVDSIALASKQAERVYVAADSHVAGLLNTEVAPEDSYQFDLTTGHLWYGSGERTNLMTNVFVDSYALLGTPALSLGGKHRYCDRSPWSCSLLIEVAWGYDLTGDKRRIFGGLAQHSLAYDLDSMGRFIFGLGASAYSTRNVTKRMNEFSDDFNSWFNLAYDYPFTDEWSIGGGFSSALRGLEQELRDEKLTSKRLPIAKGRMFHIRTQYALTHWQISAGGALMSVGAKWSLWPVLELSYSSVPRL